MQTDLHAACERIAFVGDNGIELGMLSDAFYNDCKTVAKLAHAYLATHPADDAEPIDEAWLRSIGFDLYDCCRRWGSTRTDIELYGGSDIWQVCVPDANDNAVALATFTTRRQLRDLLAAMGVV